MSVGVKLNILSLFRTVPILSLTNNGRPTSAGHLLTDYLNQGMDVKCPTCDTNNHAKLIPEKGKFTLLAINRRGFTDKDGKAIPKISTRVSDTWSQRHQLLGDLVSVITHKGSVNTGHWHTYTKTDSGICYLNSDSKPPVQINHPLKTKNNETAEFLVYKNS